MEPVKMPAVIMAEQYSNAKEQWLHMHTGMFEAVIDSNWEAAPEQDGSRGDSLKDKGVSLEQRIEK